MKTIFSILSLLLVSSICFGQKFSISNERMNIFYIGIDNPVSFAVEGIKTTALIIRSVNGKLSKETYGYIFRPDSVGRSEIILYTKSQGKLKEVGRSAFRAKPIPPPVFHIGRSSNIKSTSEITAQQYVRAELMDGLGFDARFSIETYKVCIFSGDSCKYQIQEYHGNEISTDLHDKFQALQDGDTVLFKDIYVKGPDGKTILIEPLLISIKN